MLYSKFTMIPNAVRALHSCPMVRDAIVFLHSLPPSETDVRSRQIADNAGVAYDGRPHRRIMKALRTLGILTSEYLRDAAGRIIAETLVYRRSVVTALMSKARVVASFFDRDPGPLIEPLTGSDASSEPLKTTRQRATPIEEPKPLAGEKKASSKEFFFALGLAWRDPVTGRWLNPSSSA